MPWWTAEGTGQDRVSSHYYWAVIVTGGERQQSLFIILINLGQEIISLLLFLSSQRVLWFIAITWFGQSHCHCMVSTAAVSEGHWVHYNLIIDCIFLLNLFKDIPITAQLVLVSTFKLKNNLLWLTYSMSLCEQKTRACHNMNKRHNTQSIITTPCPSQYLNIPPPWPWRSVCPNVTAVGGHTIDLFEECLHWLYNLLDRAKYTRRPWWWWWSCPPYNRVHGRRQTHPTRGHTLICYVASTLTGIALLHSLGALPYYILVTMSPRWSW